MVKETNEERRNKELIDTYQKWLEQEGLSVITGYSVPDSIFQPNNIKKFNQYINEEVKI